MSTNSSRHEVIDGADEVSTSIIEVTGLYPLPLPRPVDPRGPRNHPNGYKMESML